MGRISRIIYIILFIVLVIRLTPVALSLIKIPIAKKVISYDNGRIEGVNYQKIIGAQRLVYVKDGNLFFLDNTGVTQLTYDSISKNSVLKLSKDGKFLAWKSYTNLQNDSEPDSIQNDNLPAKISILNLTKNEKSKVVLEDAETSSSSGSILGFDFLGNSTTEIVYLKSNGDVFKRNINSGEEEQLLTETDENNRPTYTKGDIKSNKAGAILMIEKGNYGCVSWEFYNIYNKRMENYSHQGDCHVDNSVIWTTGGDGIISFNKNNSDCTNGGVWITYLSSNKPKKIFPPRENEVIYTDSISISKNNTWIASIAPLPCSKDNEKIKKGIYSFNLSNHVKYIYNLDGKNISWTSDNNSITYLVYTDKDYDMYMINSDGSGNMLFLKGITSYLWLPVFNNSNPLEIRLF